MKEVSEFMGAVSIELDEAIAECTKEIEDDLPCYTVLFNLIKKIKPISNKIEDLEAKRAVRLWDDLQCYEEFKVLYNEDRGVPLDTPFPHKLSELINELK